MAPEAWTIEALKELLETRIAAVHKELEAADRRYEQHFVEQESAMQAAILALEQAISAALAANDRSIMKAEVATEKRFESVNEFRGQLKDQAAGLLTRAEGDARFRALADKIDVVSMREHDLEKQLIESLSRAGGRTQGISASWAVLIGLVGMLTAIITAVVMLVR